ncbi:MAG: TolC family outer membrane protein [Candidatus Sedimenticola endophacoides]
MKKTLLLTIAILASAPIQAQDLAEVYALAQSNDARIQVARSTRDAALEAKPQAQALLRPTVSLSADASLVRRDVRRSSSATGASTYDTQNLSLSLSQPLYQRSYWTQLEQADLQVAQAEASYASEEQSLIVRVAEAYFGVLSAQERLAFAQAEIAAIARQLEQSKQRFEVGLIAITAVHEAQAAYDQSRADLIQAENDIDNAREALREIVGDGDGVGELDRVRETLPLDTPQPQDIDQWSDSAQQTNLALQAAVYSADIARKNVDLQRAGHYPTLDLVGSHALARSDSASGTDADTTSIGLQLSLPLYSGGAVSSKVRQAMLELDAAQGSLDQERRSVNRQVRDAYRGVLSSISTVEALKAGTVSAQSALEATEAGFEVGTRTMVDVLTAQRDLYRAKSNYSSVRFNYILSGLRLKQAVGTLSAEDLGRINEWLD